MSLNEAKRRFNDISACTAEVDGDTLVLSFNTNPYNYSNRVTEIMNECDLKTTERDEEGEETTLYLETRE